jgi:hypothetical protein
MERMSDPPDLGVFSFFPRMFKKNHPKQEMENHPPRNFRQNQENPTNCVFWKLRFSMVKNKTRIFPKDFSKTRNGENVGSSGFRRFFPFSFFQECSKRIIQKQEWENHPPRNFRQKIVRFLSK